VIPDGAVVVLQARMASRRLPGKALATLGSRSVLEWCLRRLVAGSPVPVLLATTLREEDDLLVECATDVGVGSFRGSVDDVLMRMLGAARSVDATYVARATADNPAVDVDAVARTLAVLVATGADHVVETDLPIGAAIEAVTVDALERAARATADPADREHVTTKIRSDRNLFTAVQVRAPESVRRPDLRFTIDTADDLRFMRQVVGHLRASGDGRVERDALSEPSLADFIAAADRLAAKDPSR
jgi:spore coat polysaccharide biosynthesis protein SpsF